MRVATSLRLATSLLVAASGAAIAQDPIPDGDWRTINRDLASTRFSPLAEIDRSNVARLTEAWSYPFRSFTTAVPIVIDGTPPKTSAVKRMTFASRPRPISAR